MSFHAILIKNDVSISNLFPEVHKRGIHTDRYTDTNIDTHTRTHDDRIRRNAMRCISPKNGILISSSTGFSKYCNENENVKNQ